MVFVLIFMLKAFPVCLIILTLIMVSHYVSYFIIVLIIFINSVFHCFVVAFLNK